MFLDNKDLLEKFSNAVAIPLSQSDTLKWPVRAGKIISPVRKYFAEEFFYQLDLIENLGAINQSKIFFQNSTQIWRMSHHLINGLEDMNVEKSVIANKILKLLEIISILTNNNSFFSMGEHLIYESSEFNNMFEFEYITSEENALLLKFSSILWAYAETLYFVAREISCEYHGPYYIDENRFAIIRDYQNLSPVDLWKEFEFSNKVDELRIISFHDASLKVEFDIYNNLYIREGNLATSMISGIVLANNNRLSSFEIRELTDQYSSDMLKFYGVISEFELKYLAQKYIDIFWYRKKGLSTYLGKDWKPSLQVYTVLNDSLLSNKKSKTSSSSQRESIEEIRKRFNYYKYL